MNNRGLFILVILFALVQVLMIPVGTYYPLMTTSFFNQSIGAAGLVETLFAVGMLVGGIILGIWGGTKNKMLTIFGAVIVYSLICIFQGLLPSNAFILFIVSSAICGIAGPFLNGTFMVLIQEKIAPEYLGRVTSVALSLMTMASPIGLGVAAIYTNTLGIPSWFVLSGVVGLFFTAVGIYSKSVRNLDK